MRPHAESSHGRTSFALRSFDEAPLLLLLPRLCESGAVIFHGLRRGLIEIASATTALTIFSPFTALVSLPLHFVHRFILPGRGKYLPRDTDDDDMAIPSSMRYKQFTLSDINIAIAYEVRIAKQRIDRTLNTQFYLLQKAALLIKSFYDFNEEIIFAK